MGVCNGTFKPEADEDVILNALLHRAETGGQGNVLWEWWGSIHTYS